MHLFPARVSTDCSQITKKALYTEFCLGMCKKNFGDFWFQPFRLFFFGGFVRFLSVFFSLSSVCSFAGLAVTYVPTIKVITETS